MEKKRIKISQAGTTNKRGYTLIELIVVMVIIGLVLFFSVPVIRVNMLSDELDKTSIYLGNKIAELRAEAVREQVDCQLHIDMDDRLIWTTASDTTSEKREEQKKMGKKIPDDVEVEDVQYMDREKQTTGDAVIDVFKKHYALPAVIHLKEGPRRQTLVVEPFLPDLTIIENYVEIEEVISGVKREDHL